MNSRKLSIQVSAHPIPDIYLAPPANFCRQKFDKKRRFPNFLTGMGGQNPEQNELAQSMELS